MPDDFKYDVFLSHSSKDKPVVRQIGEFLRDKGLKVWFDEWIIKDGHSIPSKIDEGLEQSRVLVLCMSANAFGSDWTQLESQVFRFRDPLNEQLRFIPLRLDDAKIKGSLAQFKYIDWRAPDAAEHDKLLNACKFASGLPKSSKSSQPDPSIPPDTSHLPNTVPAHNKNFTGRVDELGWLRKKLATGNSTGVIYGVHGLGGMGKTELAYTYAHIYARNYPGGRFLIRCEGKTSLRDAILAQTDFMALFRQHISDDERKQPDIYFAAMLVCLRHRLTDPQLGRTLLVLDNVTDLSLLEPSHTDELTVLGPKLHLLATTRLVPPNSERTNWLPLGRLPEDDALDLLEKHRSFPDEAERQAGRRIVKRLGGFTLMVELVSVWLAKHSGVTCAAFLQRLGMEDIEALDALAEERDVTLRRHNDEKRLKAVLEPTLAGLAPVEQRILEYAALLPPDQVPVSWLHALVGADFPECVQGPRPGYDHPWQLALDRLIGLTLFIRPDGETAPPRLVTIHRVIQDFLRRNMEPHAMASCQQAVDKLIEKRNAAFRETTNWVQARWELEPFAALANRWDEASHPNASWLLNQAGMRWCELAEWSQAEPLMRRALAIDERSFGPEHPKVAIRLNNLAQLLQATNRLKEAEPLMRRALAIDEKSFGQEHPSVARDLSNLAQLLQATNRLKEAEPLMRRALAIDEKSFGQEHPDVAIDLNNLAQLLKDTNRLKEAEPFMRRALAIDERSFGPEHPKVAICLNNLAQLLQATNRLKEAEPLMRRALAIDEKSFGQEHPSVARDLSNLAQLLKATNRLKEAEPLLRRALAIDEKSFGQEHPDVAIDLNNLAQLLKATNRLKEAEPLLRRALAIDEKSFGQEHPDVAIDLNNLAQLLKDTNRLKEAEPLMRRALAIDERSFGPEHPKVAIRLNNLAQLLKDTNRLKEAEPLMRRALEIFLEFTRATGHQHPHLQSVFENYADLLHKMGRNKAQIRATLHQLAPEFFQK